MIYVLILQGPAGRSPERDWSDREPKPQVSITHQGSAAPFGAAFGTCHAAACREASYA